MVHLVDGVLPENYYANNLQALSVDMAVFRDLLKLRLPNLSKHLDALQKEANENPSPGACRLTTFDFYVHLVIKVLRLVRCFRQVKGPWL